MRRADDSQEGWLLLLLDVVVVVARNAGEAEVVMSMVRSAGGRRWR